MTKEKITQILNSHKKYLNGAGGCRADLGEADLHDSDLIEADLSKADLREANLREANLSGADLSGANLRGTNLRESNLSGADLSRADLRGANLRASNLRADLSGADLCRANLTETDLRASNLSGANLREANLSGADLLGADIDFSCLPLWCGSLTAKFDDKQIIQFLYHIVKAGLSSPNVSDRIKSELEKLIPLANDFHRAIECGMVETIDRAVKSEKVPEQNQSDTTTSKMDYLEQYIQSLKQLLKL